MELIKRKTAYFFNCHAEINDDKSIIPENYLELEEDIAIAIEVLYKEGYDTFLLGMSSYFEVLTATIYNTIHGESHRCKTILSNTTY